MDNINASKEGYLVFDIETNGLDAWYGNRITCICAKVSTGEGFLMAGYDEIELINSFLQWCYNKPYLNLVSANGISFDLPFIFARATLLGIPSQNFIGIRARKHFDIMKIIPRFISLDNLAILFSCKRKTGTGKNAITLFEENKFEELKEYCFNDVLTTEEIFIAYENLKELKNQNG